MQKNATEAFTRDKMSGKWLAGGSSAVGSQQFCRSATAVPATVPAGAKYISAKVDWDTATPDPAVGFYCLKFGMDQPQYYSYNYTTTGTGQTLGDNMLLDAQGDLDGNGVTSDFSLTGKIDGTPQSVVWNPTILEVNPDE
jgi:hypothetical protein